ncbi:uncharacterized protein METZ01_LOCUS103029 [marine metagenome]|uniref:Uncharacterized protein n=1 Tax=marine metagenome TaxID=408172 RepID=A0A381WCF1_9ZZZZ
MNSFGNFLSKVSGYGEPTGTVAISDQEELNLVAARLSSKK